MEEGAAVAARREAVNAVLRMKVVAGKVKSREEGFKGRVTVDEGREGVGPILDEGTE